MRGTTSTSPIQPNQQPSVTTVRSRPAPAGGHVRHASTCVASVACRARSRRPRAAWRPVRVVGEEAVTDVEVRRRPISRDRVAPTCSRRARVAPRCDATTSAVGRASTPASERRAADRAAGPQPPVVVRASAPASTSVRRPRSRSSPWRREHLVEELGDVRGGEPLLRSGGGARAVSCPARRARPRAGRSARGTASTTRSRGRPRGRTRPSRDRRRARRRCRA